MARPEVTGRKRGPKARMLAPVPIDAPPPDLGALAYSIPAAGAMVGLGRAGSYAAAERGEIPTKEFGARKIVPAKIWLAMLGLGAE
jgi:hypothetical protein